MDDPGVDDINAKDPKSYRSYLHGGISPNRNKDIHEVRNVVEVLMRLDLELAYSSQKLMNLDIFLMHMLTLKNDNGGLTMESNYNSKDSLEKALAFDLLSGIMDFELREVENSINTLQIEVIDAGQNITSSRHLRELLIVEEKLCDCEEYLKQSRVNVLEMKKQADKMQRILITSLHEDWRNDMDYPEDGDFPRFDTKSVTRIVKQQRHILRMLEKSTARELDLEKKISELELNEEELKLKLRLTDQVALCLEEASEFVWGRFLEAENAAEVLMGTSKDLVGQLLAAHCHLSGSVQREDELKSRLQDSTEQLKSPEETYLQAEENRVDNTEVLMLREKVTLLEEQLKESEKQLRSADAYNRLYAEQLKEMERTIGSLKDSLLQVEIRAESAESKLSDLKDTNMELIEELGFLKGSDNKTRVENESLLEKVRELEIQLQQAKALSEASQEQQIMLYSAIWDMETLIGDLKSKASKAESKTQNAEEQCHTLSETNSTLTKKVNLLKCRIESLETSLGQANDGQVAWARDINNRTKLIMEMISQLNFERENLQNQFHYYVKENKYLMEKLQEAKKDTLIFSHENGDGDAKEFAIYNQESSNGSCRTTFKEALMKSSFDSSKVDEASKDAPLSEAEAGPSISAEDGDTACIEDRGHSSLIYALEILAALASMLAMYLFVNQPDL